MNALKSRKIPSSVPAPVQIAGERLVKSLNGDIDAVYSVCDFWGRFCYIC